MRIFVFSILLLLVQSCSQGTALTGMNSTASAAGRVGNFHQLSINNHSAAVSAQNNVGACGSFIIKVLIPPLLIKCMLE